MLSVLQAMRSEESVSIMHISYWNIGYCDRPEDSLTSGSTKVCSMFVLWPVFSSCLLISVSAYVCLYQF